MIDREPPIPKNAIDNFVEFVDTPSDRTRGKDQIVRAQTLPTESLRERDPSTQARFRSRDEQTVLEERRAKESGITQNRSQLSTTAENQSGSLTKKNSKTKTATADLDLAPRRIDTHELWVSENGNTEVSSNTESDESGNSNNEQSQELQFPNMAEFGLQRGRSTVGESLPNDIKIGNFTALNTDRHLYYSFYARAEELIRHRWEKYVRAVLYSYERTGAATGDEFWVTRIEIVLDKDGNFIKGMVHQGSGLQGLDLAPVHAFREAKQVPHPPPEMIRDDGTIRMDYEFNVRIVSRYASGS